MNKTELVALISEVSAELNSVKDTLANTSAPRISHSDIEDVSDAYQSRLEYNYWVEEQKESIELLEKELAGYKDKLNNLYSSTTLNGDMANEFNDTHYKSL